MYSHIPFIQKLYSNSEACKAPTPWLRSVWNCNDLRNQIFNPQHKIFERVSRDTTVFHAYPADKKFRRNGRCYFTATDEIINLEYIVKRNIICKRKIYDIGKLKIWSSVLTDKHNHTDRIY